MPQGNRRCDTCDHYQALEPTAELGFGGCRRYPPQYVFFPKGLTEAEQRRARWVSVKPDDWCAEREESPMVRLPQYEIFAGSGHDTFDQAAAARARLQAADAEAVARWFAR